MIWSAHNETVTQMGTHPTQPKKQKPGWLILGTVVMLLATGCSGTSVVLVCGDSTNPLPSIEPGSRCGANAGSRLDFSEGKAPAGRYPFDHYAGYRSMLD
jgi:hypothetical protein